MNDAAAPDVLGAMLTGDRDDDNGGADAPKVYVCSRFNDVGNVCGETFDASQKLASHVRFQHSTKEPAAPKSSTTAAPSKGRTPPASAAGSTDERVAAYAAGVAFYMGLLAMAPGPVDLHDVAVIARGAKEWARALDAVADKHAAVRQWADMVLAGGVGGPYFALVLASLAMVLPILAHHGVLPEAIGSNAAQLLGGLDESAAAKEAAPPPAAPTAESSAPAAPAAPAEAPTTFAGPLHVEARPQMMEGEPPIAVFAPPPIIPANGTRAA